MEVAHDSTELYRWLNEGEVDMLAMQLPRTKGTLQCKTQWLVRDDSKSLSEAIDQWYHPDLVAKLQQKHKQQNRMHTVRRKARPVMLNAEKGIISHYDEILQRHATSIGWDWRLLAAQCYQESAYDPKAVSWAGAQGLMQIMPETAAHLGVNNVWNPEENIAAGVRYLKELSGKFQDIGDRHERIFFVLAAYNGGTGHVRDAMALARKHGRNPNTWRDVSPYILLLEQPQYYHDPAVKFGYLRGSETEDYVRSIHDRWRQYCGQARHSSSTHTPPPSRKSIVRSRESFMLDSLTR